jgi:hypothetical protein
MANPKKERRTLLTIPYYPRPHEIYNDLMLSVGWPYKTDRERYLMRDRALASLLYIAELRVSEALPLIKKQFVEESSFIRVNAILLSKRKPGKIAYRDARLPLEGERAKFTELVRIYLESLEDEDRLFPWSLEKRVYIVGKYRTKSGEIKDRKSVQMVGTKRAWKIVNALLPNLTQHWLRAFGEDYLYDKRDHDLLAVADEVKVDARTLQQYIRRRHEKYKPA